MPSSFLRRIDSSPPFRSTSLDFHPTLPRLIRKCPSVVRVQIGILGRLVLESVRSSVQLLRTSREIVALIRLGWTGSVDLLLLVVDDESRGRECGIHSWKKV